MKKLTVILLLSYLFIFNFSLNAQQNKNKEISAVPIDTTMYPLIPGTINIKPYDRPYQGEITKDTLLKANKLICSKKNYEIVSFVISAAVRGKLMESHNNGNIFSEETQILIHKFSVGTKIFLEVVWVRSPENKLIQIESFVLRII